MTSYIHTLLYSVLHYFTQSYFFSLVIFFQKYVISIAAAVTEVIEYASARGATRKPSVEQVVQFTIGAEVRGMMPSMQSGGGSNQQIAFGTPRVDDRMHVTFLQTGGTIDKDYPKMVGGYAFEITDPAVGRILQNVPTAFTHDIHTVCRKDSTEVTLEDRQVMLLLPLHSHILFLTFL